MNINRSLLFVASLLSAALLMDRSHAATITFDDISVPAVGYSAIPPNYANMSWTSGWYVAADTLYKEAYGNSYGSPSGENSAFNGYGLKSIGFSSQSTFDFSGVNVAGWGFFDQPSTQDSAKSVTIEGYRNNRLISSITLPLSSAGYKWLQADLRGVDEIRFISSDNGKWWLADDISLNQSNLSNIARTSLTLEYPFGSSLPISSNVLSAPNISSFPSPDKLTATNLAKFVEQNGDQFDLSTRLVLQTLAGVAELPVIGVPFGKGIDLILDPSERLKELSTNTYQLAQGVNFLSNMWGAGRLLDQAGGQIDNLSNSQFIDFTKSLVKSIDIGSELSGVSTGPFLEGLSSIFSVYGDAKNAFKFSSALLAKDPVTALVVANKYIWLDLIPGELKILGLDPLDPLYKKVYIPNSDVAIEIPYLGDQSLQILGERMLTESLTYYQLLDALNITFDRYTAAYLDGDSASAALQLQAWLYYLNTIYDLSENLKNLIDEFRIAFATNEETKGVTKDEALEAYSPLSASFMDQSPSDEVTAYLSNFVGLDADFWSELRQEFINISPALQLLIDDIPGGLSDLDVATNFLGAFVSLGEDPGNSVPEPSALALYLVAFLALFFARMTSTKRWHARAR